MKFVIQPSLISGEVVAPPSKSHTLRAILFALMADGKSIIENHLHSPDTDAMIDAVRKFGAIVDVFEDRLEVTGVGGKLKGPYDVIDAGNSGIVFRFMAGIAALSENYVVITGDESIRTRRPIKPLLETLTSQNILAESANRSGFAPIIVRGPMKPGVMAIEGGDSQPVSALLIATSFLKGPSEIYVMNPGEKPWIDVTLDWLQWLGIPIINQDYRHYKIAGGAVYKGFHVAIPGDYSSSSYLLVAGLISQKSVRVSGLSIVDSQSDKNLLKILEKMGAKVEFFEDDYAVGVTSTGELNGIEVDMNNCIDMTPLVAALACFSKSKTVISGVKMARFKESDRIHAITTELKKMGAQIEEKEDGLVIYPSPLHGAKVYSHKDHRIALSLIVAAFGAVGESIVDGVECIAKTYSTFLYDCSLVGGKIG